MDSIWGQNLHSEDAATSSTRIATTRTATALSPSGVDIAYSNDIFIWERPCDSYYGANDAPTRTGGPVVSGGDWNSLRLGQSPF